MFNLDTTETSEIFQRNYDLETSRLRIISSQKTRISSEPMNKWNTDY